MLRKLIKHELRATGRLMLPMLALLLVTAVGGNLSVRFFMESDSNALNILGLILITAFIVAIAAACVMALALMIQRFYKNLLLDEGYVMLTLPVSVHQHIWSKLIVSLIWFIAAMLAVMAAIFVLLLDMGLMEELSGFFVSLWPQIAALAEEGYLFHIILIGLEALITILIGGICSCLHFYGALALGHSFSSRKMLWSVLLFFAFNFGMQLITGLAASAFGELGITENLFDWLFSLKGLASVHPILLGFMLYNASFGLVFYLVTAHCMSRRLNLD